MSTIRKWNDDINRLTTCYFMLSKSKFLSLFRSLFSGVPNKMRPLKNAPFCPISASGSNFNPRNTQCIRAVKIFAFLELKQKLTFLKGLESASGFNIPIYYSCKGESSWIKK